VLRELEQTFSLDRPLQQPQQQQQQLLRDFLRVTPRAVQSDFEACGQW
jgi:hypothetical protein